MIKKTDSSPPQNRRTQWNKGLVELALLALLRRRPLYGLEILERLNEGAGLEVADGTIYPLLHRLEAAGQIESKWETDTENGRPRKYYALTPAGRDELAALSTAWAATRDRIDALLDGDGHDK